MKFAANSRFWREALQYQLRSACPDCRHFCPTGEVCQFGWPTDTQKRPLIAPNDSQNPVAPGEGPETVEFCKEFELK